MLDRDRCLLCRIHRAFLCVMNGLFLMGCTYQRHVTVKSLHWALARLPYIF